MNLSLTKVSVEDLLRENKKLADRIGGVEEHTNKVCSAEKETRKQAINFDHQLLKILREIVAKQGYEIVIEKKSQYDDLPKELISMFDPLKKIGVSFGGDEKQVLTLVKKTKSKK